MSVRRVMGTETEYAVSRPGDARANPVRLSFDVVAAADDSTRGSIRWDYRQEDPVNDARGHRLERAAARLDMLTDAPQLHITNIIAPNGGRVYVDHAHPEYSAPETTNPFEAVRYDHAGDLIMYRAAQEASRRTGSPVVLYRNNVDGKGASWGTHENYMMLRSVPFDKVAALMTAHLVTRQLYTGSGRVGLGERCEHAGFQLSQRADYIHMRVGLQTTFDRPIVNTRDESHSTDEYRRLHVIVGDANRMDVPQALKLGTTSLLLWLLEVAPEVSYDVDTLLSQVTLDDPVAAMHEVSHDLTLGIPLQLADGGTMTAWQIQTRLLTAVFEVAAMHYGTDSQGTPIWPDAQTRRMIGLWRQALADVAAVRHADDDTRLTMADEGSRLEWLLKWQLLERMRRRLGARPGHEASWSDPNIAALDLRWAALDPKISLFEAVKARTERLDDPDADALVAEAAVQAPETTRAWLRAHIVEGFTPQVVAASWSRLTVREPDGSLFGFDMSDPLSWTRARCEHAVHDGLTQGKFAADVLRDIIADR